MSVGSEVFDRIWKECHGLSVKPDKKFRNKMSEAITDILNQAWLGNATTEELFLAYDFIVQNAVDKHLKNI